MPTFSRKSALLASAVADAEAMSPRACNNNQQLNIFNSFSLFVISCSVVIWWYKEDRWSGWALSVLGWDTKSSDGTQTLGIRYKAGLIQSLNRSTHSAHIPRHHQEKRLLYLHGAFFRGNYYRKLRARSHCVLAVNFAYLDASLFGNRSGKEGIYLRTTFNLGENGRKRRL